jgi:hypothetical protein
MATMVNSSVLIFRLDLLCLMTRIIDFKQMSSQLLGTWSTLPAASRLPEAKKDLDPGMLKT